jgi:hypothetical protein
MNHLIEINYNIVHLPRDSNDRVQASMLDLSIFPKIHGSPLGPRPKGIKSVKCAFCLEAKNFQIETPSRNWHKLTKMVS